MPARAGRAVEDRAQYGIGGMNIGENIEGRERYPMNVRSEGARGSLRVAFHGHLPFAIPTLAKSPDCRFLS